ncbi:hypothetical protein ANCCAN_07015 [Ancylostoma caninum]|uniref:Uncharacterized protein n=1 Tax=Ancylostoma caninum TaxID=29170 RepID=A0A368GVG3_ANCCA|nr:hypothetical protein ANCCAN_07015 [Ancylostoma caninum]
MGYADEPHDISPIQNYDDEDVYKLRVSSVRKIPKYPWFGWTNTGKAIARMIELFDVRRRKIEMAAVAVGFSTDASEMAHIACSRKNLFHIVKGFDQFCIVSAHFWLLCSVFRI